MLWVEYHPLWVEIAGFVCTFIILAALAAYNWQQGAWRR